MLIKSTLTRSLDHLQDITTTKEPPFRSYTHRAGWSWGGGEESDATLHLDGPRDPEALSIWRRRLNWIWVTEGTRCAVWGPAKSKTWALRLQSDPAGLLRFFPPIPQMRSPLKHLPQYAPRHSGLMQAEAYSHCPNQSITKPKEDVEMNTGHQSSGN